MGRLEALFHGARRLPKDQRGAWLAQQCGDDHALREDIERMLAADDECPPTSTPTVPPELDASELASGDRVGSFTVLEEIGHGGMGSVYLAEQREPVRRRAALKVIKLGMDSKAVLARFEIERQALAMMDHSHIAKVFEAGTTGSGRPYFAMEYVKGIPITRYCDQHKLSLDERLQLFSCSSRCAPACSTRTPRVWFTATSRPTTCW